MPSRSPRRVLAVAVLGIICMMHATARASNVAEFPDNGSEQMARGGAWVARASDPLAVAFNPAGLAGQESGLTLQSNLIFHRTCFTRIRAASDKSLDLSVLPDGTYPRACRDIEPNLNPQIAGAIRLGDRVTLGFAAIGPSAAGNVTWPDFVGPGLDPSPNRFLLNRQRGIVLHPQIGVGAKVTDRLSVGASLMWGIAALRLSNTSIALNTDGQGTNNDVRANLQVRDDFVPGFTVGGLLAATDQVDIGVWYKWSDAIRAKGDVGTAANYYTKNVAQGNESGVKYGDTIFPDCGTGNPADVQSSPCGTGNNATVKIPIPMEAKLGIRFHKPRFVGGGAGSAVVAPPSGGEAAAPAAEKPARARRGRDPMRDDVFDVELDLTWANDSALDALQVRFPADPKGSGDGILPVSGIPGVIPPNGDVPKNYRDVVGARAGGDFNVLPDRLAFRAGSFFETAAGDPKVQNIDIAASWRLGLAVGGTYRVRRTDTSALDIMIGYGHIFVGTQENKGPDGIPALAGSPCNPVATVNGNNCPDGRPKYRTNWPVNLGTITNSINVFNLGATYRF